MTMDRQIYETNASLLFELEFSYNEASFIAIIRFSSTGITRAMLDDHERSKFARNIASSPLMIEGAKIEQAQNQRLPNLNHS